MCTLMPWKDLLLTGWVDDEFLERSLLFEKRSRNADSPSLCVLKNAGMAGIHAQMRPTFISQQLEIIIASLIKLESSDHIGLPQCGSQGRSPEQIGATDRFDRNDQAGQASSNGAKIY